jgi:hypothetical protein
MKLRMEHVLQEAAGVADAIAALSGLQRPKGASALPALGAAAQRHTQHDRWCAWGGRERCLAQTPEAHRC